MWWQQEEWQMLLRSDHTRVSTNMHIDADFCVGLVEETSRSASWACILGCLLVALERMHVS